MISAASFFEKRAVGREAISVGMRIIAKDIKIFPVSACLALIFNSDLDFIEKLPHLYCMNISLPKIIKISIQNFIRPCKDRIISGIILNIYDKSGGRYGKEKNKQK